eukprot:TRINITY_DN9904_c0_g1_i3.p1 TRINITY_DN9904_c0_g1~~TRINITY_DN9904_c0_g1_i3.p1  ORF type:complete len:445 (-),score=67.60 TRINITY_DN9904_c0_g1_i3:406-1740(-)
MRLLGALIFQIACLFLGQTAHISVMSPPSLMTSLIGNRIGNVVRANQAQMLNRSIIVEVKLPKGDDGCGPFEALPISTMGVNPFLIVEHAKAKCLDQQIVRNALMAGARGVIIIGNINDVAVKSKQPFWESPIPVLMIGRNDGEKLLAHLQVPEQQKKPVTLHIVFSLADAQNSWQFWLSPNSALSFSFVREIKEFLDYSTEKNYISIEPRFAIQEAAKDVTPDVIAKKCVYSGRYCQFLSEDAQEVLAISLIMKCMWRHNSERFFDFLLGYGIHCVGRNEVTQDCALKISDDFGYTIGRDCALQATDALNDPQKTAILQEELEASTDLMNIHHSGWPILYNPRANALVDKPFHVRSTICRELARVGVNDAACDKKPLDKNANQHIFTYTVVTLSLLIIGVCVFRYFRTKARRELSLQMESQIDTAIAQYYNMMRLESKTKENQ